MPRPVAHLANLDLNLLVALRELLRERSVTRAAERLVDARNPALDAGRLRLEDLARLPWVAPYYRSSPNRRRR
jgi:hypothetical protein